MAEDDDFHQTRLTMEYHEWVSINGHILSAACFRLGLGLM